MKTYTAGGAASSGRSRGGKGARGAKPTAEQEELDSLLAELDAPKAPPPEPAAGGKKKKKKKGGAAAAERPADEEDLDAILAELGGGPPAAAADSAAAGPAVAVQPAGKRPVPAAPLLQAESEGGRRFGRRQSAQSNGGDHTASAAGCGSLI